MRLTKSGIRAGVKANTPDLLRYFIRRVSLPEDAADLLGDTLLAVWKRASDFPSDPTEARMWMFGIARNIVKAHTRTSSYRDRLRDRLREEYSESSSTPQLAIERKLDIDVALSGLSANKRELVMLVHGEGFTVAQAGILLEINASTARSRYAAALTQMRSTLEGSRLPGTSPNQLDKREKWA
jgi:RNA polymerase sigma-70 factor (ECF subfamily)